MDSVADDDRVRTKKEKPRRPPVSAADDDMKILIDEEIDALTNTSSTTRWRLRRKGKWPPLIEVSPGVKRHTLGQIRKLLAVRLAEAEARKAAQQQAPRGRGRPRKQGEAAIPAE